MGDDLISRGKLLEELNNFSMRITGSVNAMALVIMEETKKSIVKIIDGQPAAFDAQKVINTIDNTVPGITNLQLDMIMAIIKSTTNVTYRKTKAGEMAGIKKCPFCGEEAELKEIKGFDRQVVSAHVFCQNCEASTRNYATADVAIEAWNRRYCG